MSIVEGKVSRSERITALVLEVQARRARGAGETDATSELLRLVMPILKRIARRYTPTARGSFDLEDLEQIGAIATLKFIDRYQHGRAWGASTFEAMLAFEANNACKEQIHQHGRPVRRWGPLPVPSFVEIEIAATVATSDTPEALLASARTLAALHRGLNRLSPARRDLVQRHFGIGGPARSLREIGRKEQIARCHLARERDAALLEMREALA